MVLPLSSLEWVEDMKLIDWWLKREHLELLLKIGMGLWELAIDVSLS